MTTRPYLLATGVIALVVPVHFFVSQDVSVAIAALLLAVIAGAYIGFAATDGRGHAMVIELGGATLFGLAALLGLLVSPLAIPVALFAHAAWDLLHHSGQFGARVPQWYVPFCVWVDVAVGAVLFWLYWP